MLELIILKTTHGTEAEAKKLIPYIKSTDIFSMESALQTEELAILDDNAWHQALNSWSRSELRRHMQGKTKFYDKRVAAYILAATDYQFLNKKPKFTMERFSPQNSEALYKEHKYEISLTTQALQHLGIGERHKFYEKMWQVLQIQNKIAEERDKEIARNIPLAEEIIRQIYPSLRDKNNITLTIQIGYNHHPEKYTNHPINVIDLKRQPQLFSDEIEDQLANVTSIADSKKLMLYQGAHFLVQQDSPEFEYAENYQELLDTFIKMLPNQSF